MTQREFESGRERSPDQIQSEIERERAVQRQDVKAIGEQFTPEQIKDNAKGVLSDAKQEGATMMRDAKDAAMGSLRTTRDRAVDTASDTAHELSERARQLGSTAGDYARRAGGYARNAGTATGDFVTTNAIPLSLIGLGVGWLALSLRKQSSASGYYTDERYAGWDDEDDLFGDDEFGTSARTSRGRQFVGGARERAEGLVGSARERAEGLVDSARERAEGLVGSARERASGLAESARGLADSARERATSLAERASHGVETARTRVTETASHLSHQAADLSHEARERMRRAQLRTRDFADENPLAVGAIAIAAGVGVGLLLPTTSPENRLMGETRDRLVGDARELIGEARAAGDRVTQKARETAQELRGAVADRIQH